MFLTRVLRRADLKRVWFFGEPKMRATSGRKQETIEKNGFGDFGQN